MDDPMLDEIERRIAAFRLELTERLEVDLRRLCELIAKRELVVIEARLEVLERDVTELKKVISTS